MWKLTLATGILAGTMCVTASAQYPVTQPNTTYVPSQYGQAQLPFTPPAGYMPGNNGVAFAPQPPNGGPGVQVGAYGAQPQTNARQGISANRFGPQEMPNAQGYPATQQPFLRFGQPRFQQPQPQFGQAQYGQVQSNQPQLGQPYVGQPYTPNQPVEQPVPTNGSAHSNLGEPAPYFESSIYRSSSYARQSESGPDSPSSPVESGVELSGPQSPVPSTLNDGPVLLGPDGSSNSNNFNNGNVTGPPTFDPYQNPVYGQPQSHSYTPGSTGTHGDSGSYQPGGFGSGHHSSGESYEGPLFGAPPVPSTFSGESCGPDGGGVLAGCGTGLNLNLQPKWNKGWFFQYDHMLWTFEPPNITTIGDDASERFVTIGGVTVFHGNSLNTSYVDYDLDNGDRFEFGFMDDCDGWIGGIVYGQMHHRLSAQGVNFVPNDPGPSIDQSYLAGYVDANADGIDDDISGNSIHGRHGEDLGTPDDANPGSFILPFDGVPDRPAGIDFNDLVRYLVTFENFSTRNQVTMTGFELMKVKRYERSTCSRLDCFYGVRYLNVEDDFSGLGTGGILDSTHWDLAVQNRIIGPQFGTRYTRRYKRFALNLESRCLIGWNFQDGSLQGQLATRSNDNLTGQNEPVALVPTAFNHSQTNTEFSPVSEWRAETQWDISDWLTFRAGYTGFVIDGFSYASPKMVYVLPGFGMSNQASAETVFSHAITFGLEMNR